MKQLLAIAVVLALLIGGYTAGAIYGLPACWQRLNSAAHAPTYDQTPSNVQAFRSLLESYAAIPVKLREQARVYETKESTARGEDAAYLRGSAESLRKAASEYELVLRHAGSGTQSIYE